MARKRKRKKQGTRPISYQAKDVFSKVMADLFKGESFAPFGVDLPKVVYAEPTNLPAIEANELRMDTLFRLEDGSYAIVDYESEYNERNKLKYLGYLVRVAKRLYNDLGYIPKLRLIILYTADVKRGTTNPVIDLGCGTINMNEGFLSELDQEALWHTVSQIVENDGDMDSDVIIRLMVYPLSFESLSEKQDAIRRVMTLVERMSDDKLKGFILSGMMVFGDKVILPEDAEEIRRKIMSNPLERLIETEMQAMLDRALAENTEKVTEEVTNRVTGEVTSKVTDEVTSRVTDEVTSKVTEEVTESVSSRIAKNMLMQGDSVDKIALTTEMPVEAVKRLQAAMA